MANIANAPSTNAVHEHCDSGSFTTELMHHLPYAIFSVALGMMILSLLDYTSGLTSIGQLARKDACSGYHMLFHSFHFLHILFAATGTIITFSRFSTSFWKALVVGIISPTIFCMLSDILFPYIAGRMLSVDMELHICFHKELQNVLPFLIVGIANGMVLRRHHTSMLQMFSLGSHVAHILISSLAALFYIVSHGFSNWYPQMGILFLFLVVAIVVPCTLSDVVVPMYLAGVNKLKGNVLHEK